MDIRDKISKLLALAESPNEAEALAALLKARELMMRQNLSAKDFDTPVTREVKEVNTGITCSRRRDQWIEPLSRLIANHHCCRAFMRCVKGKQTKTIHFWGLEGDVDLCHRIFQFALSSIHGWLIAHEDGYSHLPANVRRDIRHSYAKGYIAGIEVAYRKQTEAHQEWGLVAVIPQEVQEKAASLRTVDFSTKATTYQEIYQEGYEDGCKFDPSHKLPVNEAEAENEMEI